MERLEPTRGLALKVWWSFFWRATLFGAACGFGVGLAFRFLQPALRLDEDLARGLTGLLSIALALLASIEVMFRVLRARFDGCAVAFIRNEVSP